jgi:hypothetical protein
VSFEVFVCFGKLLIQENINMVRPSQPVRMVPNAEFPIMRAPLETLPAAQQEAEKKKPVRNVVVLIHGHNEREKAGNYDKDVGRPWYFSYKRDVWTKLYEAFLAEQGTRNPCIG